LGSKAAVFPGSSEIIIFANRFVGKGIREGDAGTPMGSLWILMFLAKAFSE
jgi:hypothetical protein